MGSAGLVKFSCCVSQCLLLVKCPSTEFGTSLMQPTQLTHNSYTTQHITLQKLHKTTHYINYKQEPKRPTPTVKAISLQVLEKCFSLYFGNIKFFCRFVFFYFSGKFYQPPDRMICSKVGTQVGSQTVRGTAKGCVNSQQIDAYWEHCTDMTPSELEYRRQISNIHHSVA